MVATFMWGLQVVGEGYQYYRQARDFLLECRQKIDAIADPEATLRFFEVVEMASLVGIVAAGIFKSGIFLVGFSLVAFGAHVICVSLKQLLEREDVLLGVQGRLEAKVEEVEGQVAGLAGERDQAFEVVVAAKVELARLSARLYDFEHTNESLQERVDAIGKLREAIEVLNTRYEAGVERLEALNQAQSSQRGRCLFPVSFIA